MLRLNSQYVIRWCHFGFCDDCVALSTAKFDWSVKTKSILEVEVGRRWVGSDMTWWKQCEDVRASRCPPSTRVLSFFHQKEDLALTSPMIIVKRGWCSSIQNILKIWREFFKFSSILARRSIDNTNISLTILNWIFINNAFTGNC